MSKYIKPPTLSTNFSESGKSAKKRFENILNTNVKKTSIWALSAVLVITGILGAMVAYDSFAKNNEYLLSDSKLSELSQMSIGADMATLDYASEDKVIFHYSYALIVYSLKEERIIQALDLSTLNVPINTQGSTIISVQATADGNNVIIAAMDAQETYDTYVYNISKNIVKKIKHAEKYQLFAGLSNMDYENIFNWSSHHCVWLSETKRCYLLLKDSFHVSGINIIVEDGKELIEYTVFKDAYANAAATAKTILDEMCMEVALDADASEYLAEHKTAFDNLSALSKMDKLVLPYLFSEFENNDGLGIFREGLMMLVCREILGDEDIEYTAARGFHWYSTIKDYIVDFANIEGENAARSKYPKASMILDYSEYDYTVKTYYKQVMEYMAAEHIKTFSPYYDVIDQIASNYKENISGDDFEATFFYKEIYKNYYKDPDTVEYIKKAKEQDVEYYKALYDDYNAPKEGNYEFKITAKIQSDKSLDMGTVRLYANSAPKGTSWEPISGFADFIMGEN